jgi:phage repressor protein C with HTH and peptisase S24 domain
LRVDLGTWFLFFCVELLYRKGQIVTDPQEEKTELLRDFAFRLHRAAEDAGLSQVDIADKIGAKRPRVGNWFQGRNLPKKAERLALSKLLGVTVEWLVYGTTENDSFRTEDVEKKREIYGGPPVREIPVVSWSHAGEAATYEELPRHFHGRVATSSTDPRAFAVTVEGDCMEPKFFAGDRVVLEPSQPLRNGKPVVAKHADDAVQLRVYTKLPTGVIRLASLRPEIYPTVDHEPSSFHWIYPVRELVRSV